MFGKYNGFVSKARVSACMYFLVRTLNCPVSQVKVRKSCILSIILYTANSKKVVLRKSQTKA